MMKLPKLPRSRPSSATASPVSSPRVDSPSKSASSPRLDSPSKSASTKSSWPDRGKAVQLCMPLSRSRSRAKREVLGSGEILSPAGEHAPPSPLGVPNANISLYDVNKPALEAAGSSHGNIQGSSHGNIPGSFLDEMRHAFAQFDANGDGKISAEELRCVLRSLGDETTHEEALLMVAEVDADGDGFIDLHEFIDLNTRGSHAGSELPMVDELAAAFDMFDLDKNGRISPDELHCVLVNLGNHSSTLEDCRRMIRGVDRKGSGHVDFDDFKTMMTTTTTA